MKYEVFWKNSGYSPRKELKGDINCDYLIVGGGIMGVSLAYFLNKLGAKNIVLIEKNEIGTGATGKSAGFLALKGELDLVQIMNKYGKKRGLLFWKGNREGLNLIRNIVKKEKINCDFEQENTIYGTIVKGRIDKGEETNVLEEYIVEKDIEKDTELIVGKQLRKELNSPLFSYAIKSYDHGASVDPLKFVQSLSKKLDKKVKIYENTKLLKTKKNTAITPKGRIKFKKLILAIDTRIKDRRIKALRSTITISQKLTKSQLKELNLLKHKMIWDSEDIYHYLKITPDNRILIGYGDKKIHKKNPHPEPHIPHVKRIESFYKKIFPGKRFKIEYAWSGNFGITNDRIPIIEQKGNIVKFGGSASQVVCVISAKHLAHQLLGRKHYLDEFFKHLKRADPGISLFSPELGLSYFTKSKKK